jgi:hypothetical protein
MVLQGEGRGKFSSLHLEKYFVDQNRPKMGRYDPNLIIIYFYIYISTLWVKKLEELACRAHFNGKSQFGDLGSRTF